MYRTTTNLGQAYLPGPEKYLRLSPKELAKEFVKKDGYYVNKNEPEIDLSKFTFEKLAHDFNSELKGYRGKAVSITYYFKLSTLFGEFTSLDKILVKIAEYVVKAVAGLKGYKWYSFSVYKSAEPYRKRKGWFDDYLYRVDILLVPTSSVSGFGFPPLVPVIFGIAAVLFSAGLLIVAIKVKPEDIGKVAIGFPLIAILLIVLMAVVTKTARRE
ncbi:MAG: hypothetical protein DRP95_00065 [Candidatus Latescibacterota bacterium]|nr:MAG: hypothetical protein DRP95_00065 [Candidatus Latescibacterota bacterium]